MEQREAMRLISGGISEQSEQHWADFGCGSGTFTRALAGLLPWNSYIHAVDKQQQELPARINEVTIGFSLLNFCKGQLNFNDLDGILMANSLHYVRDKSCLLSSLERCFRKEKRMIIVEYENRWPSPWVPYPISFSGLAELGKHLGYRTEKLALAPSRFGGTMYCALLLKK